MIQDQLVEYVSSQIKLGIARDTIKAALVGAGWQTVDIEDTLKKIEGDKAQPAVVAQPQPVMQKPIMQTAQPAQSPISNPLAKPSSPFASFSPSDIVGGAKSASSQLVRMSDFVSGPEQDLTKKIFDKKPEKAAVSFVETSPKKGGSKVVPMLEAVVIIGLAALSVFLYLQNNTLGAKVSGLGGKSTDVASQIASLTSQVQSFTASNANLTAQVASLTAENADLQTSMSFFIVPSNASNSASSSPVAASISGTLQGGGKLPYVVTTAYGVKLTVKNSSDIKLITMLSPLVGSMIQVAGTHLPGSALVTVTAVNGNPLVQNTSSTSQAAPAAAASGTASTSTAPKP